MKILAPKSSDVLGSVWLATALLTYDAVRTRSSPPAVQEVVFRQAELVRLASQLCSQIVHSPRVQQWANGDHPRSTRNYLRTVGAARRLSSVDDFEGERTIARDLFSPHELIASWSQPEERLVFRALVSWVSDVYSEWALTFPPDEPFPRRPRPPALLPKVRSALPVPAPSEALRSHATAVPESALSGRR
jgi:hypothetical protein